MLFSNLVKISFMCFGIKKFEQFLYRKAKESEVKIFGLNEEISCSK